MAYSRGKDAGAARNRVNYSVFARVLLALAMLFFILAVVITAIELAARDEDWVRREYEKLDINMGSGMTDEAMTEAFMLLIRYMAGETDSLSLRVTCFGEETEMYNEHEISHMRDVRSLYSRVITFRNIAGIAGPALLLLFLLIEKRERGYRCCKYYLIAIAAFAAAAIAVGIWVLLDFYGFWLTFHRIFLDIESSVFNSAQSRMIRICPGQLFSDMVMRIICLGFGFLLLLAAAAAVYLILHRKKAKRRALGGEKVSASEI